SVRWYDKPSTFPLGGGHEAVLLLDDPSGLPGPPPPDLSGLSVDGDPVRWLWIIPISERSRLLAKERGPGSLVSRLAVEHRGWIVNPPRGAMGMGGGQGLWGGEPPCGKASPPRGMDCGAPVALCVDVQVHAEQDQPPQ